MLFWPMLFPPASWPFLRMLICSKEIKINQPAYRGAEKSTEPIKTAYWFQEDGRTLRIQEVRRMRRICTHGIETILSQFQRFTLVVLPRNLNYLEKCNVSWKSRTKCLAYYIIIHIQSSMCLFYMFITYAISSFFLSET